MARKRTGLMEDLFGLLLQLPWWVGIVATAVFWGIGLRFGSGTAEDPLGTATQTLLRYFFNICAVVSLAGAIGSSIRSRSRRKLLDRQRGIDSLRALSWREFEHLVGEAYRRRGYHVEETGGSGPDGGVDLKLYGHGETVLVQCKQWRARRVGVDKVRELFGVVTAADAARGILVTSGTFTNDAHSFAAGKPIDLVDGPALTQLVRDVQASPSTTAHAPAPAVSSTPDSTLSCPRCGRPMVLRIARRGSNAGSQFYGCSTYPACRATRPVE